MQTSPPIAVVFLASAACLATLGRGNVFLGRDPNRSSLASPLLEDLEKLLGSDRRAATESRVLRLEVGMRPIFEAMPKTTAGLLGADAVRYMVHRYFVERHGWFVKGLDTAGEGWDSSSPATIFKEHVGEHVHDLFEEHLTKDGFSLHQAAVLAATLESFVHTETLERLHAAYSFSGVARVDEEKATEPQVKDVIETYMIIYVLGLNYTTATSAEIDVQRSSISEAYPTWGDTQKWVSQVQDEVLTSSDADSHSSFNRTIRVLEEIGDRYGRWQNSECLDLKESLVKLEDAGSGRVRLETFYESALQGNWQFSESVGYLRQLGALDETDPNQLSIVIPNYVNAPSNCVASSKFYSVCCINECESLLNHLEVVVAAPEASPSRIAALVAALPSATVTAPRELSLSLLQKLEDIGNHHGGTVPFHGRLFGQWMHHAYPRECPYPHLSGTTKPLAPDLWQRQTDEEIIADVETMTWHVEQGRNTRRLEEKTEDELPWVLEEELFLRRPEEKASGTLWSTGRAVVFFLAIVAAVLTLTRMAFTTREVLAGDPTQKYVV